MIRPDARARRISKPGKLRLLSTPERPSGPLRVVFYLRVSPDESLDDGQESTIDNQRDYLKDRYAVEFGPRAHMPMQLVGEYVDDQITGTIPLAERPAGAAMLAAAARGEFDAVLVLKIDRFGRTATYILDAAETLDEMDIGFISSVENINTTVYADELTKANAKFFFTIMAALAELDIATLRGRTHLGRRRHAKAGEFLSGPVPFGYDVDQERHLVESTRKVEALGITEAELVREIFRRIADDGWSCSDIVDWLNRSGVPAVTRYYHKDGKTYHNFTRSGRWYSSRISRMIADEKHAGTRTRQIGRNEFVNELGFELVDPALRAKAKLQLSQPGRRKGKPKPDGEGFLLRGLLICTSPACVTSSTTGRPHILTGYTAKRPAGEYRYYRCAGRTHSGSKHGTEIVCTMPQVKASDVETALLDDIESRLVDSVPTMERLEETVNDRLGITAEGSARREELQRRLARLQQARLDIRESQTIGQRTAEEAFEDFAKNAAVQAEVKEELDLLSGREELAAIERKRLVGARTTLESLASRWAKLRAEGGEALREQVMGIVQRINVLHHDDGVDYEVKYTFEPVRPAGAHICMSEQDGRIPLSSLAALGLSVTLPGLRRVA